IEQCISPVHIILRRRLEFNFSKKIQCTKTGFQRCAMQIAIAIKDMNDEEKKCKRRRHEMKRERHEAEQSKRKNLCYVATR
ncbi:conserved hypothetical protein, partial [Trichinella spiralis]|uniref:hypothetical protein n=1 Tax=Trichinella spiralis TaxID=6334 RepID=UPI0001EFC5C9